MERGTPGLPRPLGLSAHIEKYDQAQKADCQSDHLLKYPPISVQVEIDPASDVGAMMAVLARPSGWQPGPHHFTRWPAECRADAGISVRELRAELWRCADGS